MAITITDTSENFEYWLNKEFVTEDLKNSIKDKSILLVPFEGLRETENPFMFPVETENVLQYFNQKLDSFDICITDEEYQEFAFYSNYKRIGNFLVLSVALPLFLPVLSSFIYDKYVKSENKAPTVQVFDNSTNTVINTHISDLTDKKHLEPTHVKFTVTVVDSSGKSKNINYEGPASNIDSAMNALKEYEE